MFSSLEIIFTPSGWVVWALVWASKVNPDGLVQVHFSIAVSEEQLIDKGWPMLEILSMSELSLLEVGTFP